MIRAEGLGKQYGERWAVRDLDVEVGRAKSRVIRGGQKATASAMLREITPSGTSSRTTLSGAPP